MKNTIKSIRNILKKNYFQEQSKKGIKFKEAVKYWHSKHSQLIQCKSKVENSTLSYPPYFTEPIHTYENGHLNWTHAYQTKCHMEASALMSIEDITNGAMSSCSPEVAHEIYKKHILKFISHELNNNVHDIADFGCGTGELTELISSHYTNSYVAGIDLSPYYLSIASYKHKDSFIQWIHANIEYTELSDASFDAVIVSYAFHEMIPEAIEGTIKEAHRLLRIGGKLIIVDMDPEKIPSFPSFIDISEPHLQKFRNVNILNILKNNNFIKYERKHMHQMSSLFVGTKSSAK